MNRRIAWYTHTDMSAVRPPTSFHLFAVRRSQCRMIWAYGYILVSVCFAAHLLQKYYFRCVRTGRIITCELVCENMTVSIFNVYFCACYVVCNNSVKIKPVLATRHKPAVRAAAATKYQVIPFTWQMFALSRSVNESEKNNPGFIVRNRLNTKI